MTHVKIGCMALNWSDLIYLSVLTVVLVLEHIFSLYNNISCPQDIQKAFMKRSRTLNFYIGLKIAPEFAEMTNVNFGYSFFFVITLVLDHLGFQAMFILKKRFLFLRTYKRHLFGAPIAFKCLIIATETTHVKIGCRVQNWFDFMYLTIAPEMTNVNFGCSFFFCHNFGFRPPRLLGYIHSEKEVSFPQDI